MAVTDFLAQRRPQRADAQRNFDALIIAAREVFTELGTDASLEEIARRAGVGIATLYRNFPTREELIELVYVAEVAALCKYVDELTDLKPWYALIAWLQRFVSYMGTKRALIDGLNRKSDAFGMCRDALYEAGGPLLRRAQECGSARTDVDIDDIMRFVIGITAVNLKDDAQRRRIFAMAMDGMRAC
jgi:AcrR family transcriptional regulator